MKRSYINEIIPSEKPKKVLLKGWVQRIRLFGNLAFIILRDFTGTIQCVALKKNLPYFLDIKKITPESVIEIQGTVKKNKEAKKGYEVIIKKLKILSKASTPLPIDIEKSHTHLDKRLDHRFLDLRRPEIQAIFKIQAKILQAFRSFFIEENFLEIVPPILIEEASEGGTDVFPVKYFEKTAYLAQSPQLYKQMAISAGLEKVFMITPVFRAEKHNTTRHLNESRQLDIEIGFANHEKAMKYLEKCLVYILKNIKKTCKEELKLLNTTIKIPKLPFKRLTYNQICKNLKMKYGEDLKPEHEKILSKNEPVFITEWPLTLKPFYAMPSSKNPKLSNSFDLLYKGLELASGAQRIHDNKLLAQRFKAKSLNPVNFKNYIESFIYGCPEHAGWSIGLERLTMAICNLSNIREAALFPRDRNRLSP